MRLLVWSLRALLIPLWLLGVFTYLFLSWHAVTLAGRAGLAGFALLCSVTLLVPCFCLPLRSCGKKRRVGFAVVAGLGILLLLPLPLLSPSGTGGDDAVTVEHVYTSERMRPSRFSVGWMVPEVDQIAMGVGLAPWFDAHLDAARAARLRDLSLQIYREMDRDPALAKLGSMMGAAYDEVLGGTPEGGHYLAMVPRKKTGKKRMPLLVFLHGSAGSFASYWKVLAPLARRHGVAVICPTFGFGNWFLPGGLEHVMASIKDARRRYPVITGETYLVGLSNGGTGVSPAVASCGRRCFAGVAYISGVFDTLIIKDGVKGGAWRGLPVLVIHGHQDLRIPPWSMRLALELLKAAGARLSRLDYPQEDHFLFFAKREQVVQRLAAWMDSQGK